MRNGWLIVVGFTLVVPLESRAQAGIANPAQAEAKAIAPSADGGSLGAREQGAIDAHTPPTPVEHEKLAGEGYTLWKLHHANAGAIKAGQLAMANASAAVKKYGRKLLREVQAADQKVVAAGNKEKVDLEARLAGADEASERQLTRALGELQPLHGGAFDARLLALMSARQQELVTLLTEARKDVSQAAIHPLVDELLPLVRRQQKTAARLLRGRARE